MKTLCLFNPRAGRFNAGALEKTFRGRPFWGRTEFHALGPEAGDWDRHLADGDKALVLGGDGTIHHVIQRLAFRNVEVNVVPAGTANDLGYCLGVQGRLSAAMDLLERGRTVAYDTIAVNGRHVITGGGFGLGYLAAASANRLRSGPLGFLFRSLRAKIYLATLGWHGLAAPPKPERYCLRMEGSGSGETEEAEGATQSLLFCNQALMGKRVLIAPGTSGMDGRFHLVEFLHGDTRGILRSLAALKALKSDAAKEDPLLRRAEVERAILEFENAVPAYGDGEELPPRRRWELVCHRGAVRLRVPAAFPSTAAAASARGRSKAGGQAAAQGMAHG